MFSVPEFSKPIVYTLTSKDKETRDQTPIGRPNPNTNSYNNPGSTSTADKAKEAEKEKKRLRFFDSALRKNPITLVFED